MLLFQNGEVGSLSRKMYEAIVTKFKLLWFGQLLLIGQHDKNVPLSVLNGLKLTSRQK